MRKLLALVMVIQLNAAMAQLNLVPNPGFEDTLSCPDIPGPGIASARFWTSYRGTPDHFHSCANNGPVFPGGSPVLGVPMNRGGFQHAFEGDAYGGLYTFSGIQNSNMREFMGTILTTTLVTGTTYYFSCYVSNGDSVESNASSNNFGMLLSTIPYNAGLGLSMMIPNNSILNIDTILSEKNNWVRFSGSFTADSAYRFLALGNFYNDASTLVDSTPVQSPLAYYFVDAVCLTTDSLYNETWTGTSTTTVGSMRILIHPNPAKEFINIHSSANVVRINIVDLSGRILKSETIRQGVNQIDISMLQSGIYLVLSNGSITQKMMVID